jgi:DNA polymerase kappa
MLIQSIKLAGDLSRLHFAGRTLTLKIKLDTFEVLSRSITPAVLGQRLLSSAEDLYKWVLLSRHSRQPHSSQPVSILSRHAKHLLEREIESRHASFSQGKRVLGCKGARDMSVRLLGIKVCLDPAQLHPIHNVKGKTE